MKTLADGGLTKKQRENVGHFLDLFADVEAALKKKLNLQGDDRTGVRALINAYELKNPHWRDAANHLRHLADIRNVLTHQRGTAHGYPVAVTLRSVDALRELKERLIRPEPIAARYRRKVLTVSGNDSLANIVALAFEHGFSQFPVVNDGKFGGLITETEITRWLGHRVRGKSAEVDLQKASVRSVLKEKDPTARGLAIFRFKRLNSPVEEVMAMFSLEATLEVVLLTESGSQHAPIEGIITQWDAARFSPPRG